MFRSYDLWVMSPTRFRCANSLQGHPCRNTTVPMQQTNKQTRGPLVKPNNKTTWRIRVSIPVLNLAKVVCYHVQQSPAHTLHITPHLLPTHNGPKQQRFKSSKRIGGSGYRSRFSTLRRLYATMYNNPPSASFGTRTRTYTLEGCNSTLKLRMHPAGLWSARGVHTPPLAIHGSCTPPAWMAEWSKALDSSSSLSGGVGSNPTSSTLFFLSCRVNPPPVGFFFFYNAGRAPVAQLSSRLAQLVERQTFNLVVVGSSPTVGADFLLVAFTIQKESAIWVKQASL